jgi:predicted 3-demethylubiquinone-9 3-methyltransferase (glyoxalase superfamily)
MNGDVLTVEFTVIGIPCLGLNGGPAFKHSEAFSFQVATTDQAETDHFRNIGRVHLNLKKTQKQSVPKQCS